MRLLVMLAAMALFAYGLTALVTTIVGRLENLAMGPLETLPPWSEFVVNISVSAVVLAVSIPLFAVGLRWTWRD